MLESLRAIPLALLVLAMLVLFKTTNDGEHLWSSVADPVLSTLHCYPMSSSRRPGEAGPD